ncbi:serine hydrolase domain-containing protein [Krasilnikovia sp. M28-CT-15]|uniref:serine hydrolase domain-containing protein n=1 Tax=Krasilnikovia sp. M28-CT-15 TaxID=3373540 RepID=UPI00399CE3E6
MPNPSHAPSTFDAASWQQRLHILAEKHRVAGAALGILSGDTILCATYGMANARARIPVQPDTVFQIGSITKVYTTTAVQCLVAQGLLDLEKPLSTWLPELRLADGLENRITLRHLVTHTSGIAGDIFTDTGRGDDCLERYVDALASVPSNLPPGESFSYCNSGFSLVGRIISAVTGRVWDAAMHDLVFKPLGLENTMTLPEEAILHSAAVGHERQHDGTFAPVARWVLPRSGGPAGGIISSVSDVLAFARFHLHDGSLPNNEALLPAELIRDMRSPHAEMPFDNGETKSVGLGWFLQNWGGHSLFGHDGDTISQTACLRVMPSKGLAVALLTNGGPARDLYRSLCDEIFAELAGVSLPPLLQPKSDPEPFDLERHAGVYQGFEDNIEVVRHEGVPLLRWTFSGSLADVMPTTEGEYETVVAGRDLLLHRDPGQTRWRPATFVRLPDGRPCLYAGNRAYPQAR